MKVLAVIPARGGSKGLPRKNVLPLCGKPLIAWMIEAAKSARHVDRVVVSTDDAEIAAVAREYGAEVIHRPAEISGDAASSESALLHALDELDQCQHYVPDVLVFLQCTAPLTTAGDIDCVVETLLTQTADSAFAAAAFDHFLWRETHGDAAGLNHEASRRLPRQQRPPDYLECGSVYAMRAAGFQKCKHRFFGKTVLHAVPRERCWEIDEPAQLAVAETLLRRRLEEDRSRLIPANVEAVVFDFDGVLTDNRVLVDQDGVESVSCNRSDGLAISQLRRAGMKLLVLSSETNRVVAARCEKLNVPCLYGIQDKWPALRAWLHTQQVPADRVVYVGNDLNDSQCIQRAGCGVAVADACAEIRSQARLVLNTPGGGGVSREVADLIFQRKSQNYDVKVA